MNIQYDSQVQICYTIFFFGGGGGGIKVLMCQLMEGTPSFRDINFTNITSLRNHSVLRLNSQIKIKPYPTVSSHQIKLIFVFGVILQCVYIPKWRKQFINFVYGLVVGHVAYEQLYLGRVCTRRLSTMTRWRESRAISASLVQISNPLGLRGGLRCGRSV